MQACVIFVTVPNAQVGESIAQALVATRLAACVNRLPGVVSLYHWLGKIENDAEEMLIIKTRVAYVDRVAEKVKFLHPYQVPEVIAIPIIAGEASYLEWLEKETASPLA